MDQKNLLAPWCANRQQQVLRVKSVQLDAALSWPAYNRYAYLIGVGVKLHHIPRHICGSAGSAIEQLERAQRLISFMDATGCLPIGTDECPRSHAGIPMLNHPDHVTWWLGANGEPLALYEPYTPQKDLLAEITARELPALVLPHPGIYGGGGRRSTSVFLADPENEAYLRQLSAVEWRKPMREIQDINWFDALNLGKGRQS